MVVVVVVVVVVGVEKQKGMREDVGEVGKSRRRDSVGRECCVGLGCGCRSRCWRGGGRRGGGGRWVGLWIGGGCGIGRIHGHLNTLLF